MSLSAELRSAPFLGKLDELIYLRHRLYCTSVFSSRLFFNPVQVNYSPYNCIKGFIGLVRRL